MGIVGKMCEMNEKSSTIRNESAYRITTLTPVSIGDGNTLSAFADYVLEKGKIHYINQQIIRDKMGKNPELIDFYVEGMIRGKSNTTNTFDLKNFIFNRLTVRSLYRCHRRRLL